METAVTAVYRAVRAALIASQPAWWGGRVYADIVPEAIERPYVVYTLTGGGEANARRIADADITLAVQVVAETLAAAQTGAGYIAAALNDADLSTARALTSGNDWWILTVSQQGFIHYVEDIDGKIIYHAGAQYAFRMEAK